MFCEEKLQYNAVNQHINSVHNFRKYHKHINKSDKTEPCSVEYYAVINGRESIHFSTKAQLYDYLECVWRNDDVAVEMFKITKQKLMT